jgi:hypothetical protein
LIGYEDTKVEEEKKEEKKNEEDDDYYEFWLKLFVF